ncbi:MAG: 3-oxoacyl-ACP synthase III family protein [Phycisphaerae bacterium]|nr:3-oxoacyl-ACP synthase III family protein [Phycisphaerae bacterium]MCZ2401093.1 3-oxoacyl-ACP synthase III family protein [Phycisphaerae bacterium]
MNQTLLRVGVTGTGSFLPNAPVTNDQIDNVLGRITDAPPRVLGFIESVGKRMLDHGGVRRRHFAVDPETHELTHNLATLAEPAARRALEAAGREPRDVDLLLFSSPSYDQTTPPTSTALQERLGIERCAEMEIHSNCAGVGKMVQVAYDALRLGRYRTALIVYSQLSSVYLRAQYFNQAQMTKTQAALRYILADGSAAIVLENAPPGSQPPHEVLGAYVESIGGKRPPGMTAGGGVADVGAGADPICGVHRRGAHHLDQDFAAVNRDAAALLLEGVCRMLESLKVDPASCDHFIGSVPTMQLYGDNLARFQERLNVGPERLKFRATDVGYVGGTSILLHLDDMVRSGELLPGQTAVLHSVESSKWMSAGFIVRW